MVRVVLLTVLVVALEVVLAGCADQIGAFRADAAGLAERWALESRAWESRVARMKADDPLRPDAEAALARARAKEAAASAAVQQVDLIVQRAKSPDDPLGRGLGALSPLLPEPVRWPLALGAALVASVVRGRQLREGMSSIARGLDKAMEEDPAFESAFRKHANTFRSIQTTTARRVIDASQRRKKAA